MNFSSILEVMFNIAVIIIIIGGIVDFYNYLKNKNVKDERKELFESDSLKQVLKRIYNYSFEFFFYSMEINEFIKYDKYTLTELKYIKAIIDNFTKDLSKRIALHKYELMKISTRESFYNTLRLTPEEAKRYDLSLYSCSMIKVTIMYTTNVKLGTGITYDELLEFAKDDKSLDIEKLDKLYKFIIEEHKKYLGSE